MLSTNVERKLVWDNDLNTLVLKYEIYCLVVGNCGSIFFEEGPLYVEKHAEIISASSLLKERLQNKLGKQFKLQNNEEDDDTTTVTS